MSNSKRDGNFVPGGDIGVIQQLDLTTKWPQTVAILDGSGNQITSFGGGTQYTEGDTDTTITGTAAMMEVAANVLQPIQGTVADGLLVNLGGNNDVTVTGSVAVTNAGLTELAAAINVSSQMDVNIAASGTTVPVSGTFWQATQPVSLASVPSHDVTNAGTFAVQAAQSGTWNVTNISGTVSLPTGAATAAKQPALGTAGLASSDVLTVQGIASMTALKVDNSGVTQPVSGTVAATQSGSWSLVANQSVNVAQMNGVATTMGNGVSGTGVQRVTIASDSTGQVSLAAGTAEIGNVKNSGTFATQATLQTGSNIVGKVGIDQTTPGTTNAVSIAQLGANTISTGVGASGTGTQRIVPANDMGKTLLSAGGSASSSGNNTLIAAGSNRLKVYAFSLSTVSTTAVTCIFQSGASGTELWRVILQTPASVAGGANLVVQPPAWLFATASATLLNLNLSAAVAVNWSVSYFDEA